MSRNRHPRLSLFGSLLAGVALMFGMPLAAQAASYTYIDQKTPYSNWNPPMLTAVALPKIGTTFKFQVPGQAAPFGFAHGCKQFLGVNCSVAFGVSNPNVSIPALGGFLFTSAEIILPAPSVELPGMMATMSFPIPNSPRLLGVKFYQQVLWGYYTDYCPSAPYGPRQPSLSRGGVGVIGK